MDLHDRLRAIPDFPKSGITFIDIMPLLADAKAFRQAVTELARFAQGVPHDVVVSPEARGFLIGAPLSLVLDKGFVAVRKPGKLPAATVRGDYELEYGTAALEMHRDAIRPGMRALVVDDLLATGGTVAATADLVRRLGGTVAGFAFLVELTELKGRARLREPVFSVIPL
jgi:adenine phosphoribosyltransferase